MLISVATSECDTGECEQFKHRALGHYNLLSAVAMPVSFCLPVILRQAGPASKCSEALAALCSVHPFTLLSNPATSARCFVCLNQFITAWPRCHVKISRQAGWGSTVTTQQCCRCTPALCSQWRCNSSSTAEAGAAQHAVSSKPR